MAPSSRPNFFAHNLQVITLHNFMLNRRLVHVSETLTDLQILGCESHKNAFGDRTLPGPAREL